MDDSSKSYLEKGSEVLILGALAYIGIMGVIWVSTWVLRGVVYLAQLIYSGIKIVGPLAYRGIKHTLWD